MGWRAERAGARGPTSIYILGCPLFTKLQNFIGTPSRYLVYSLKLRKNLSDPKKMKLDRATFRKKFSDSKNEEKSLFHFLLILGDSYRLDNSSNLLCDVQIS